MPLNRHRSDEIRQPNLQHLDKKEKSDGRDRWPQSRAYLWCLPASSVRLWLHCQTQPAVTGLDVAAWILLSAALVLLCFCVPWLVHIVKARHQRKRTVVHVAAHDGPEPLFPDKPSCWDGCCAAKPRALVALVQAWQLLCARMQRHGACLAYVPLTSRPLAVRCMLCWCGHVGRLGVRHCTIIHVHVCVCVCEWAMRLRMARGCGWTGLERRWW